MRRSSFRFLCAVIVSLLFLVGFGLPAKAQVIFDAASNATPATLSAANPIGVSWNHTTGSAKKMYLTVGVSIKVNGTGGASAASVTYGTEAGGPTQAMTLLGSSTNGTLTRAEIWGLAAPTAGVHQITVSVNNANARNVVVVAGAKTFSNVFQTAAAGAASTNTGTTLAPTVTVASNTSTFDYVVDAVAYNNNVALTPGAGQTNSYNLTNATQVFSGSGSIETGSTNTVMSWTATGVAAAWATVAVPLHSSSPQILFDASSNTAGAVVSAANPAVVTWSHTTTTAANRYVIVDVTMDEVTSSRPVTTVTYGTEGGGPNQALTRIGALDSPNSHTRAEIWGGIAPQSGTHTITVSIANAGGVSLTIAAGAQTFSNVDQSVPLGTAVTASNTSNSPTVNVTNSAYDYVVDAVAYDTNTGLNPGATQDQRFQFTGATTFTGAVSGSRGYANTSMNWVGGTSQRWAMVAVPLKQASVIVTKTASADVIKTGDKITYTLTATNYGSSAAAGVTITDNIPAGTSFVSQTGCSGTGPVTCTVGALASGATSAAFTVTVVPNSAGTVSNVATVTYTGATNPNSSETIRTLAEARICASPGKDGTGGVLAGIRNDYWTGSGNPVAGATTMTVGARVAGAGGNTITAGDLLIVMQMQDASFDTSNDETYGEGSGSTRATGTGSGAATSLNNAGRWEYVVASNSVSALGGTFNFSGGGSGGGLLYTYTSQTFATSTTQGQRTFQVIRVPQYTTATFGSTLTALPWNGSTGGVLAVDVSGTLTLGSATVSVNGLGFRGGGGIKLKGDTTSNPAPVSTDFRTIAPDSATAPTIHMANGSKGEGIAGTPRYLYQSGAAIGAPGVNSALDTGVEGYVSGSFGRGAPGNAGGGSSDGNPAVDNGDNSGGGGGGNGGTGGVGGNSWQSNKPSGGQGGSGIAPKLTRITMGGGGGAGTTNNGSATDATGTPLADDANGPGTAASANGYYSSGANGGGIIIVRALQAVGSATLTANGFTAYNTGRDGSGGGGAGGSVLFTTQMGTLAGLTIQAKGGNGGSAWLQQAPGGSPGERHGPGGGGGGGYVLLSSAAASTDIGAGINGFTTTANDNYAAQPGSPGIVEMISGNNVLPGGDGATCAIADLAVTNVATPSTVVGGTNLTFTQTAANNGPNPADGVVYMAPIPASTSFVSFSSPAGWTCVLPAVGATTGAVICTTPTMNSGASANFSLVVQSFSAAPGYVISETNSISSNTTDSNPANNQATATSILEAPPQTQNVTNVDMAVTITESTAYPNAGSTINYTQTISNLGASAAQNPSYTLTTPPNTTFQGITPPSGWSCVTPPVNGTGTITCSGSTALAAGASFSMPLSLKVNAGTPVNTAITATPSVATTSTDSYMPNNTASVTATVVAAGAVDVAITIANSPDPVSPGQNYTYTVVATNNGPPTAATNVVTIPLPAGTSFQSMPVPAGWSCTTPAVGSGGTITCNLASFAAGASATFLPVVQVNNSTVAGTVLNITSTISTTTTETITSNNTASTSNLVVARTNADVAIVKTDSPDPVGIGQLVTYRLTVTNNGPAIATNVTVNDTLPASMIYQSATPSIGSCSGTTTIICTLGTLPVGNSQFVNIVVQATATGTISNTATVSATEPDPIPANNTSTVSTTVLAVTLVRLRDFTATQDKKNVLISWQTSFEADNLGFNIYRDIGGQQTKINKHLIAGTGLQSKKHDAEAGHVYRYSDKLEDGTFAQYWLEDVDTKGIHTMHGPVSPVAGVFAGPANTTPLPGLGEGGVEFASPDGFGAAHATAQEPASAAQYKQQLDLAAESGLKIFVNREGWYRVTKAAMATAGFDAGTDPRAISLYMMGTEQSISVDDGGDGKFDAADAIEFYGYPLDIPSTGARTYWLRLKKGTENRVAVSKINGGDPITGSLPFVYERIERSVFFTALITNGEDDNFYGVLIGNWTGVEPVKAANLDPSYGGNASLDLVIQGGTEMFHRIAVAINGHDLGTVAIDRTDQRTFTFALPQSWLVAGVNNVSLTSLNGDDDVSVMAKSRLTYQHLLRADNGAFDETLPGGRAVTIGGFGTATVRAFDITDSQHPTELQTKVVADPQGGFAATFTALAGASRTVLAFDSTRLLVPGELAVSAPSALSATNGNSNGAKGAGNFYIISNKSFFTAANALKAARDAQGIDTRVVDVVDLYDEFNFGIRSPQAIRAFLTLASSWKRAPSAAMLLGDASMDPRNYFGIAAVDFVPTKLVPTTLMKTASDDWFTDFNNDGIADLPVGRIPVRTPEEASLVIGKITSRGTPSGTWARNALFITDAPTDYDFAGVAASLKNVLPASFSSQTIDFAKTGSAHSDVLSAMNGGALLATYVGHASVEMWAGNVFLSSDASALTNGNRLPVVFAMNCLNGYFHDIFTESLAEALLKAPNGGAVGVWASSSLTQPDQQALMSQALFQQLFRTDVNLTLGEAVARAKVAATDPDVRKSWILFGDPTMKLRP